VTSSGGRRIVLLSLGVGLGLLAVIGLDYLATRRELLALLNAQAASLRQIVAAAARSNVEAGRLAETQLASRLLENARYIAELDRHGVLTDRLLDQIVERHALFRVNVFRGDGQLERSAGPVNGAEGLGRRRADADAHAQGPAGRAGDPEGRGAGEGRGRGRGFGFGGRGGGAGGPGGGLVLQRILEGGEDEAATDVHASRGRGGSRLAAGVRRASGGAIVVNVDAQDVAALMRQASLDTLLEDIVTSAPDVAYVVFEQDDARLVHGETPAELPPVSLTGAEPEGLVRRETRVAGRPVLEFSGRLPLGSAEPAVLRLGMSLDGVRRAEWRMLAKGAFTLAAAIALAGLGIGAAWLRRKYALLSEEHARAEEALRRRDRLAAMGELASTVAHEVRNPLNAIAMSAQRLRHEFLEQCPAPEAREELAELVGVVESEARRLDRTVQQFLDYARPPRLDPRPTDLAALAGVVAEASGAKAELRHVALELEVSRAGEAVVDPDQLRQALDNLVRNALDATPDGGRVRLTAWSDASAVTLEVADSGPGIPPDVLPRIFDLYFTTKQDGTGVGLAVTQQIVTAHGGTIEVDSKPGAGTRMTLRLPRR